MSGYQAAHMRTRRVRGKASEYVCDCGRAAEDWAYVPSPNELVDSEGRVYSEDPSDYRPMCRGCHRRFDKTHCRHGHALVDGNIYWDGTSRRCRTCKLATNQASAQRRQARRAAA